MHYKLLISSLLLFCWLSLTGCSTTSPERYKTIDTTNLEQLENLTNSTKPGAPTGSLGDISQIRVKALEDTAMSLGAQGGLAWGSRQINQRLDRERVNLANVFNFDGLVLNHGIMPPVLEEGDNSLNQDDPNAIRIADKTYTIVQQARFMTTPPNWHDYLWQSYSNPPPPNITLLPRDKQEQTIWRKSLREGWQLGVEQAQDIFQQDIARLRRDYNGMLIYRKLLEKKMISPPYVAKTDLGVTGDGSLMRVHDQVLRITALPQLQTDSNGWNAIVVKQHD